MVKRKAHEYQRTKVYGNTVYRLLPRFGDGNIANLVEKIIVDQLKVKRAESQKPNGAKKNT